MNEDTATLLMEAVAANRLVILCGAGLSMAAPSNLPGAWAVTQHCAQRYDELVGRPLPAGIAGDLNSMADWFRKHNNFDSLFIQQLVPWRSFLSTANDGHIAIADFLLCGAVKATVTTNFDCLVEDAARTMGESDFQSIIFEEDLPTTFEHRPYLKIHGCSAIISTRLATLWCEEQLNDISTRKRIGLFREWLNSQFLAQDILVVGFWSDWAYLTAILLHAIAALGPRNVFLVDISSEDDLKRKSPAMWDWANAQGITLHHEQQSGADFLAEFRVLISRAFIRHVLAQANAAHLALFNSPIADQAVTVDGIDDKFLYALRRDFTGVPRTEPVRTTQPDQQFHSIAAIHARMLELGSTYEEHVYTFRGRRIRLVLGRSQLMSAVRDRYQHEPPILPPVDDVICIGAIADPTPANVVRPNPAATILRPGFSGNWLSEQALIPQLT